MNDHSNSNHDNLLDQATRALSNTPVPHGPTDEVVADTLAVIHQAEEAANQPRTLNLKERILIMRPRTKITVAAAVLIALAGLLNWLTPGEGTALAFNNLAEAFATIRTATYNFASDVEGRQTPPVISGKSMYMAPSRERSEMTENVGSMSITISDSQKNKMITLSPKMMVATVIETENRPADMPNSPFEQLRKQISDAQSGKADQIEQLGPQTIDGRRVIGFRIPKADGETKIWADPDTGLPVRVEFISHLKSKTRVVMSDFRFNVDLDQSLFSLEIPDGYTVNRVKMDVSKTTVEDLAQTLRVVAEHNDGTFPNELQGTEGIVGVMIKTANTKHGMENSPEKLKTITELGVKVGRGFTFVRELASDSDYHYAGKGVKLDTPNRPIFWYKPPKSDKYRVIYADLSIKDVSAEDVPKEPQSSGETSSDVSTQ